MNQTISNNPEHFKLIWKKYHLATTIPPGGADSTG